jgi:hypothetical protein
MNTEEIYVFSTCKPISDHVFLTFEPGRNQCFFELWTHLRWCFFDFWAWKKSMLLRPLNPSQVMFFWLLNPEDIDVFLTFNLAIYTPTHTRIQTIFFFIWPSLTFEGIDLNEVEKYLISSKVSASWALLSTVLKQKSVYVLSDTWLSELTSHNVILESTNLEKSLIGLDSPPSKTFCQTL